MPPYTRGGYLGHLHGERAESFSVPLLSPPYPARNIGSLLVISLFSVCLPSALIHSVVLAAFVYHPTTCSVMSPNADHSVAFPELKEENQRRPQKETETYELSCTNALLRGTIVHRTYRTDKSLPGIHLPNFTYNIWSYLLWSPVIVPSAGIPTSVSTSMYWNCCSCCCLRSLQR